MPNGRTPRTLITFTIGLVLVLSGCGDRPAAPGKPITAEHVSDWDVTTMADPCRLLTRAEVTAAVGRTATAGVRLQSWPPLCRFVLPPESTLVFVGDNPRPTGRTEFDQLRNSGQKTEPVGGLGDQAYWVPEVTTLHVLSGRTHLKVLFSGPAVPAAGTARSAAVTLATAALTRL